MSESQPKLTLILGGSRSGKSRFALELPERGSGVVFWASGVASDPEMKRRIAVHRKARPARWTLLEEPRDLLSGLRRLENSNAPYVILDSLTSWVGNRLTERSCPDLGRTLLEELEEFLQGLMESPSSWIVVSDEVGMGIVPSSRMGRTFRDLLGDINQRVALRAGRVYWVSAGIPVKIK